MNIEKLFEVAEFFHCFTLSELKELTVVSRKISDCTRSSLGANVTFFLRNEAEILSMKWYPPNILKHVRWGPSMYKNRDMLFNTCPAVTHLSFSEHYNDPVGKIPLNVLHITWGRTFNQPLPPLPSKVTHIFFGAYFNKDITSLPPNVTHLSFGSCFNKQLPELPSSLTHLRLDSYNYNLPLPPLPNLLYLNESNTEMQQPVTTELFPRLSHLRVSAHYNSPSILPPNLTTLHFNTMFNQPIDNLPSSLTHLIFNFDSRFDQPVDHLPGSITRLIFGNYFTHTVDKLPPSITHLTLGMRFNQPLLSLPDSITHLFIGSSFNQSMASLPHSITHFAFYCYDRTPSHYPPSITHLSLMKFHENFDKLPASITHFSIGTLDDVNYNSKLPAHILQAVIPHNMIHKKEIKRESEKTEIVKVHTQKHFWEPFGFEPPSSYWWSR